VVMPSATVSISSPGRTYPGADHPSYCELVGFACDTFGMRRTQREGRHSILIKGGWIEADARPTTPPVRTYLTTGDWKTSHAHRRAAMRLNCFCALGALGRTRSRTHHHARGVDLARPAAPISRHARIVRPDTSLYRLTSLPDAWGKRAFLLSSRRASCSVVFGEPWDDPR